jgi:DNA modification methylase
MQTMHRIFFDDSARLSFLSDESVHLVVTSPPYPMIEMWDDMFSKMNPSIQDALLKRDGDNAFELMHLELDRVWRELHRVLCRGGIACINIGDATRTMGDRFRLYPNYARILHACHHIGFEVLPCIIWRKTANAPTKFMGSGMLPAGAYVTLEHEYIQILRKGGKRSFVSESDKRRRMESAIFWEERNRWFSDIWDFNGVSQNIENASSRTRSAAFPFELAYRLIQMNSVREDTVLDPFLGTGVTTVAAIASGRNSVGVEIDGALEPLIRKNISSAKTLANASIVQRIQEHADFIARYTLEKGEAKHKNSVYGFPVVTSQEREMKFHLVDSIEYSGEGAEYRARYTPLENPLRLSFPIQPVISDMIPLSE